MNKKVVKFVIVILLLIVVSLLLFLFFNNKENIKNDAKVEDSYVLDIEKTSQKTGIYFPLYTSINYEDDKLLINKDAIYFINDYKKNCYDMDNKMFRRDLKYCELNYIGDFEDNNTRITNPNTIEYFALDLQSGDFKYYQQEEYEEERFPNNIYMLNIREDYYIISYNGIQFKTKFTNPYMHDEEDVVDFSSSSGLYKYNDGYSLFTVKYDNGQKIFDYYDASINDVLVSHSIPYYGAEYIDEDYIKLQAFYKIRMDKNANSYYYTFDNNGYIYQNDRLFTTLPSDKSLVGDFFPMNDYLFVLYFNNKGLNSLKINLSDGSIVEDKTILNSVNNKKIDYYFNNSSNKTILINGNDIYEFNEETNELLLIKNVNNISNVNYLDDYLFIKYNKDGKDNILILNTVNKKGKIIEDVSMYYLNKIERRLYTVENNDSSILNYYHI